jgi:predicted molibdopterin-dependent oxidoreductase YjgC
MGAGPSKAEKEAKSKLTKFIVGIHKKTDRLVFQNQEQAKLHDLLIAREKLIDAIEKMIIDKKSDVDIKGFIEKNMDSFENYHDSIKLLVKKYGAKPSYINDDLPSKRIGKYETEIRKNILDRASRTVFGRRRRSSFGRKRRSSKKRRVLKK